MTVRNFISIQLDVIDQIDVRNTDGSGAGVAAIAGAFLGAAFWGGMANDPDSGGTKGIIPVLAGAGIGAGIGMFIGFVASPGTHGGKGFGDRISQTGSAGRVWIQRLSQHTTL